MFVYTKSDYSSVGTAYSTVSFVIHIFIQTFVSSSHYCSYYTYFHYNFLDLPELPHNSNGSNGHDGFH